MNDIERARAMRDERHWVERADRAKELATAIANTLPVGMSWPDRFCAMMLAVLGCADTLGLARTDVVRAFDLLADQAKRLEVVGLKEKLGDGW